MCCPGRRYRVRRVSKRIGFTEVVQHSVSSPVSADDLRSRPSAVAVPSRPRFQPASRKAISLFHVNPEKQAYKMKARLQYSQKRMWLRDIVRAWRRFVVLQLEIRLHSKMMARVGCSVVADCIHVLFVFNPGVHSCVGFCLRGFVTAR